MEHTGTRELKTALGGRGAVLFVNFHHVRRANPAEFPKFHHRTTGQLRDQIRTLARSFDFSTPGEIREILHRREPLDANLCVLTFDDGLRDHFENVAPVLSEVGVKGLFFVNTGPWEDGRLLSVHMAHLLSAQYSYAELAEDFGKAAGERGLPHRVSDVSDERASLAHRLRRASRGRRARSRVRHGTHDDTGSEPFARHRPDAPLYVVKAFRTRHGLC
jgi:hypothetical protein